MNLIVQGPAATVEQAAELAALAGACAGEALRPHAFRLRGATERDGIAAWCDARQLDHAWIPEGRQFADLKLLAMDMDSTLIAIECID